MKFLFKLPILLLIISIALGCEKGSEIEPDDDLPPDPPIPPVVTYPPSVWEAEVDGVKYTGTIDTSYIRKLNSYATDTVSILYATGSATNRNGQFSLILEAPPYRFFRDKDTLGAFYDRQLVFDTLTMNGFQSGDIRSSYPGFPDHRMKYVIDSVRTPMIYISFYGLMESINPPLRAINLTKGRMAIRIGAGNNSPKFFHYSHEPFVVTGKPQSSWGYWRQATLDCNTLSLQGWIPQSLSFEQNFVLQVHTGSVIRPGMYETKKGEVRLSNHLPGVSSSEFINDGSGNLTVTITEANNGIVRGYFEGIASNGNGFAKSYFSCRVSNYQAQFPQSDHTFRLNLGPTAGNAMYGGNITRAKRFKEGDVEKLHIEGASDGGASTMVLKFAAKGELKIGEYLDFLPAEKRLDEFEFKTKSYWWNGNRIIFQKGGGTKISIDTLTSNYVSGRFLGPFISVVSTGNTQQLYSFHTRFRSKIE